MTPSFDDVKKGERLLGYFALCYFGLFCVFCVSSFVFLHVLVFDLVDMYYEPLLYMDMCFIMAVMFYGICDYYLIQFVWRLVVLDGWR